MKTFLPIILIVAAIGLFFFQVTPMYSEVNVLRATSAQYDQALAMAAQLDSLRSDLDQKYNSFAQNDLERLGNFLPQQLDTVRIILDVDGIGVRNGISLADIKVSNVAQAASSADKAAKASSPYQTVVVSFTFSAPYSQAVGFMKDVEQSLRLLDAANVKIRPSAKSGLYDFSMDVRTYWINR